MKLKVLLAGNNRALIQEILSHHDSNWDCQSCTTHRVDLESHLSSFVPDIILFCLFKEPQENLYKLPTVAEKIRKRDIQVIITGDLVDCDAFERSAMELAKKVLKKPISAEEIVAVIKEEESTRIRELQLLELKQKEEEEAKARREEAMREAQEHARQRAVQEETLLSKRREIQNKLAKQEEQAGEDTPAKKRILTVDDDSNCLKLIKSYLSDDYDVATAINGKVAMRFLESKKVDLVLLDYEMPGESGAQVLEKIRAHEQLKDMPVLFLTGITAQQKIKDVLAYKPQGYLLKPISRAELTQAIENVLK